MICLKQLLLISISTSLLLASSISSKEKELQYVVKIGKKGDELLRKTLQKQMKNSMKSTSIVNTFDFCSKKAYLLTQKVNKRLPKGVRVKRISDQFRSPANAPQGNEKAILETFARMQNLHIILPKYIIEKVNTHKYKYYSPIFIKKKLCLSCHGNLKNIEIKKAIKKTYPLDRAIHYKMGDLRGAVVVTVDKTLYKKH